MLDDNFADQGSFSPEPRSEELVSCWLHEMPLVVLALRTLDGSPSMAAIRESQEHVILMYPSTGLLQPAFRCTTSRVISWCYQLLSQCLWPTVVIGDNSVFCWHDFVEACLTRATSGKLLLPNWFGAFRGCAATMGNWLLLSLEQTVFFMEGILMA